MVMNNRTAFATRAKWVDAQIEHNMRGRRAPDHHCGDDLVKMTFGRSNGLRMCVTSDANLYIAAYAI